ncbi:acetylxylan esterase [Halalkalibacterium halodurans]|jgi:cephalosporin-C deacetylase|uniref:Acetylxylan esterase (Cephalosporin-C deacetylase) n=2 Tax=Halalkalibacterium halodurans TaxID=86665 RepID=Q9K7N5_HALH5|nr:acetylxylan esterase [Halalkalibacterium halodurans]MED4083102.1 acetylxylan esterase [Halalkalibacterium halodurans]MED4086996.1 acetylxylan esterase [Halalkalibacterium halodurans]MED4106662.1 acetylxylan esterase [Halalkalibacterium halodurans]MED4110976.1 acetylxylan esterase [Halalkalibacterium halodurans]MED4125654.1 acetylxylan esterase [Halalkalibacterium halodurans]
MPLIDMPLTELKEYMGRNPKPDDFTEYWDRALQEMRKVNPNVELIPSDFQTTYAECFHLYFTGVRGARIHAKYVRPRHTSGTHPAVIHFHGYTMNAGEWTGLLHYAALGYSVLAMDVRGQGGLSEDTGGVKGNTHSGHIIRGLDDNADQLLFRHVFLDTAQLANIVMNLPEVDEERVAVTGWSQGGALAIACAALEPKIKKVAPVYPFLSDYQRVWEMDLAEKAYDELQTYFRRFDPQHRREAEIFTKLGYIDIQHLAPLVKGEVLLAVGLMDTVCPPSTQFAMYNKLTTTKSIELYPDFAHEDLPGHRDRIFQFLSDL